jgi:GNAT superfamily N-acetyltransferase
MNSLTVREFQPGDEHAFRALMAVSPSAQGCGIGRTLLAAVIEARDSRERGACSSRRIASLRRRFIWYEALGFQHVAAEHPSPYARSDVTMELLLR